jgi:hypothetical protein
MAHKLRHLLKLAVALLLASTGSSQVNIVNLEQRTYRDPSSQSRRLFHVHLQNAALHGNSTDLQYFYVDVFFGNNKERQSLIVDTGSGIAAVPCKNYCKHCGEGHLNSYFDVD